MKEGWVQDPVGNFDTGLGQCLEFPLPVWHRWLDNGRGIWPVKNTLPNSTTAGDSEHNSQLTQMAGDAATLPIHQIYFSFVLFVQLMLHL